MIDRRRLIHAGLAGAGAFAGLTPAAGPGLAQTPECDDEPTVSQIAGPFFTPNSPLKSDFRGDAQGEPLTLLGLVLGSDCKPIDGALVELWHADAEGRYDNSGYLLRGHQFADGGGRFAFKTIAPGLYPGRTRHFHVRLSRPGGRALTTQLYFPEEARNLRDRLYDERLLMRVSADAAGRTARYEFVLR